MFKMPGSAAAGSGFAAFPAGSAALMGSRGWAFRKALLASANPSSPFALFACFPGPHARGFLRMGFQANAVLAAPPLSRSRFSRRTEIAMFAQSGQRRNIVNDAEKLYNKIKSKIVKVK
jgi:hypothetical protein